MKPGSSHNRTSERECLLDMRTTRTSRGHPFPAVINELANKYVIHNLFYARTKDLRLKVQTFDILYLSFPLHSQALQLQAK